MMSKNIFYRHFLTSATVLGVTALASPAMAQGADPASSADVSSEDTAVGPKDNVFARDHLTVGVGAIYGPSYDGSNNQAVTVFPAIQARVWGIDVNPRAGGVALDLIPDKQDAKVTFQAGPLATLSRNRAAQIKDPVVRAAGKLDTAVYLGANAGVNFNHLLNPYDSLTVGTDVAWDVAGASNGMTIQPGVSYMTPLSKAAIAFLYVGARHVDGDFAKYYYSVDAKQSTASGLPLYNAKSGWDKVNASVLLGYDLSGDLRDGGFEVFVLGNYTRMLGDGKDTPFTSIRGSADNWTGGVGVGYTF